MFAVPGQHDLPYHRLDLIKRSAFWTLVSAGKVTLLSPLGLRIGKLKAFGFGWDEPIKFVPQLQDDGPDFSLAVVHAFVWCRSENGYPGVGNESHVRRFKSLLSGYSFAVFGDNHKGFLVDGLLNCGTFFRRTAAEVDYRPRVGVLYSSGKVKLHYLDTDKDKMEVPSSFEAEPGADFDSFMGQLASLEADPLDFREALRKELRKHPESVGEIVQEAFA